MTHAASLISDLVAFITTLLTKNIIEKKACKKYTYGLHRAQIVGSLMSLIFTVILNIYLLEEAAHRCFMASLVDHTRILTAAIYSVILNLIQFYILRFRSAQSKISACVPKQNSIQKHCD